ncbi:MAG: DUF87 domain-containing protein [Synergistaceae bacterium]|jgi:hypothetical protein|nr:DUF87 domain-containing protein [Synergistaceae bacterium]
MSTDLSITEQKSRLASELEIALVNAQTVIDKSYLERLSALTVAPPDGEITDINVKECGTFFRMERLVTDREENFLDKLVTVANSVSPIGCSLTTIVESDGKEIKYYIGVVAKHARTENDRDKALRTAAKEAFSGAMAGNFSGSTLRELSESETENLQESLSEENKSVAAVSGIVSLRNKDDRNSKAYVQGLENLTNSLRGKRYKIIMIADPVGSGQIRSAKQGYEMLYSQLSSLQGFSITMNESKSLTLSDAQTKGITKGISEGITRSQSHSTSTSHTEGSGFGGNMNIGFPGIMGGGVSYNNNKSNAYGASNGISFGDSIMHNWSENTGSTTSKGFSSEHGNSLQISAENRSIKSLMDKINLYIERLDVCENYGAFECAAYVLTDSREDALSVAGHYNALMRGDDSFVQSSHVNVWPPKEKIVLPGYEHSPCAEQVLRYLKAFSHPEFYLNENRQDMKVRPSSLVSGKELAIQFALPKKSVHGLTVMEMTPFGRNVPPITGRKLELGVLYYMGREESSNTRVPLDVDSLTMHTFITGSTGSGKSNAVCEILNQLRIVDIPFLVIEPAKGEYKNIFGQFGNVAVYGTNPRKSRLLKINPFRFPVDEIHVLEHLDRLVELFNVCWPMYAAMPAILKEAMERAYMGTGWDLAESTNTRSGAFPVFADVLEQIEKVIEESKYSSDSKGDYSGALCTRVKSLTNGINGMIFCGDDLPDEEMFDKNVIVDLSRVGSTETKSLIMGLLVIKLQEYRMALAAESNAVLKHVTVLEEAHNLLRRTSTEQSSEGANLLGKSVELLANSIAEMRTYGEGFIIADQSPGLLDMSVIRNTNTKIILRLPEYSDRELTGKAASLNGEQIDELAKLERGVAAVYQNDWVEPILMKINRCGVEEKPYVFRQDSVTVGENDIKKELVSFLIQGRLDERLEFDVRRIERSLTRLNITSRNKLIIENLIEEYKTDDKLEIWNDEKFARLAALVTDILAARAAVQSEVAVAISNVELTRRVADIVISVFPDANDKAVRALSQCLLRDFAANQNEHECREKIYFNWFESIESQRGSAL